MTNLASPAPIHVLRGEIVDAIKQMFPWIYEDAANFDICRLIVSQATDLLVDGEANTAEEAVTFVASTLS